MQLLDLLIHLLGGDGGEVRMVHAVVAHNMSLIDHALYQFGVGLAVMSGDKEYRLDFLLLEDIQDIGGIAVFIALVKGEVDALFIRADEVDIVIPVLFLQLQTGDGTVLLVHIGCRAPGDSLS